MPGGHFLLPPRARNEPTGANFSGAAAEARHRPCRCLAFSVGHEIHRAGHFSVDRVRASCDTARPRPFGARAWQRRSKDKNNGTWMTLVVGRQKGSVISIVSDTGVTEHGVKLGPQHHLPKICVITHDLAIAFAGSSDLAKRYINEFPRERAASFRPTVDYFLDSHLESNRSVDFLLFFNRPAKIIPIKGGRECMVTKHAWIGDHDGFEAFQRYQQEPQARASVASFLESLYISTTRQSESRRDNMTFAMLGTLRYVILDRNVESVFGSEVAVNNVEGTFQYRSYTFVLGERPISLMLPSSFVTATMPERAELQNFGSSCFVTDPKCAIQGIAYHFVHGKLTYLYWGNCGEVLSNGRVISDKNLQEFLDLTKEEFGTEWIGQISLRAPPPPDYGIPADRWSLSTRNPGPYARPG